MGSAPRRSRLLQRAPPGPPDQLRGAAFRRVGAAELVESPAPPVAPPAINSSLPTGSPARWSQPGPGDESPNGRLHPAPVAVRHRRPGRVADRLLDGPTSDVWIDPWLRLSTTLGVDFRFGTRLEAIRCSGKRITSVGVRGPDGRPQARPPSRMVCGGGAGRSTWPASQPQPSRRRSENLLLASDYVRTFTDLATMEGANESGWPAVNGILDCTGSATPRARSRPLHEPYLFVPARAVDRWRY